MRKPRAPRSRSLMLASVALVALTACDENLNIAPRDFDMDLRNLGGGFNTPYCDHNKVFLNQCQRYLPASP